MIRRSLTSLKSSLKPKQSFVPLYKNSVQRNINTLVKYKRGIVLEKLKKIFVARSSLFKLMLYAGAAQVLYFAYSELNENNSGTILSITDVMTREDLKDNDLVQMVS